MKEKHIATLKTARYYILGELSGSTSELWFLFHGYGQTATDLLKKFENYENTQRVFIAPEGLSRFYRKGFFGHVGASWMTKEDRENEIKDYLVFINNVYRQLTVEIDPVKVSINLFGFSQGAATAFRVFADNKFKVDKVILCCSPPPRDVDYKKIRILSASADVKVLAGKNDNLVKLSQMKEGLQPMADNKVNFEFIEFNGEHEITSDILENHMF